MDGPRIRDVALRGEEPRMARLQGQLLAAVRAEDRQVVRRDDRMGRDRVHERRVGELDLERGRALFAEAPRPLGTPLAHVTILPVATNR